MNHCTNNLTNSPGRLGNQIIRALAASLLASQRQIKLWYGEYAPQIDRLGIPLYKEGMMTYNQTQKMTDKEFMEAFYSPTVLYKNIDMNTVFCQTAPFANYIYQHLQTPIHKEMIMQKNPYKTRFNQNQDCFLHIRLGDVAKWNPGVAYYDACLAKCSFDKVYIASDEPTHPICQELIKKYMCTVVCLDEVQTIQFGSTCKTVILSGGSYSFILGCMSFFSDVFTTKGGDKWYPDELFSIPSWITLDFVAP